MGVVGKAHAAGIASRWERDLSTEVPAALATPCAPLAPLAAAAAAAVGLPLAAYRVRAVRYALGAGALAAGAGGAWFVHALRDRLRFFEASQQRLRREQSVSEGIQ